MTSTHISLILARFFVHLNGIFSLNLIILLSRQCGNESKTVLSLLETLFCEERYFKLNQTTKMSSIDTSSQMLKKCNEISSSSKVEVHKGKSHACRSIKSTNTVSVKRIPLTTPKLKVNSERKSLRKNSLSSETISDSGSEHSLSCKNALNQLKRTKSVNSATVRPAEIKRKVSDSSTLVKVSDRAQVKASSGRLFSESDKEKTIGSSNKLIRTSSFRLKNTPPIKAERTLIKPVKCHSQNSFRNKTQVVSWNSLWESSFAAKVGGGVLKEINQSTRKDEQVKLKTLFENSKKRNLKKILTTLYKLENQKYF